LRVLMGLAVVVVFGAMYVLDTAALVRLTVSCAVGGCGGGLTWTVIGIAGLALIGILLLRQPRAKPKVTRVAKKKAPRPSRAAAGTSKNSKQPKQVS
jgi:multidrug transporter EmrE-like cation transporter